MRRLPAVFLPLLFLVGCRESRKEYSSFVQIARFDVVHADSKGQAVTADVELEWPDCPGEQREVIRGDAAFAACVQKFKIGERVPVKVDWQWEEAGLYDWDILDIGGCKRTPGAHDDSSFDMVQECETIVEHGETVGFRCTRIPHRDLLQKCPWFRRH